MFPSTSFAEKCVERVISATNCFVTGHLTVGLDAMLQAVQLPASISNLNSGLANMNRNTLALLKRIKTVNGVIIQAESSLFVITFTSKKLDKK